MADVVVKDCFVCPPTLDWEGMSSFNFFVWQVKYTIVCFYTKNGNYSESSMGQELHLYYFVLSITRQFPLETTVLKRQFSWQKWYNVCTGILTHLSNSREGVHSTALHYLQPTDWTFKYILENNFILLIIAHVSLLIYGLWILVLFLHDKCN